MDLKVLFVDAKPNNHHGSVNIFGTQFMYRFQISCIENQKEMIETSGINAYNNIYVTNMNRYFDDFGNNRFVIEEGYNAYNGGIDIDGKKVSIHAFYDTECKIINNRFSKRLEANIGYFHLVVIEGGFNVNTFPEYIELLHYLDKYSNLSISSDLFPHFTLPENISMRHHNRNYASICLDNKVTDKYIKTEREIIPHQTLPTKLLDVLGLADIHNELAKLQMRNELLEAELDKKNKELSLKSELEAEIIELKNRLVVVRNALGTSY